MFKFSAKLIFLIISILAIFGILIFKSLNLNISENKVITPEIIKSLPTQEIIGKSVNGLNIISYTYGSGSKHILFIGGIHGGYEWNSVLLAYKFIDYLDANPEIIPENLTIDIIPSANPDGVYKATNKEGEFTVGDVSTDKEILASSRFNANGVDLNRNFACKWKPKSTWQSKIVSAGTKSFSEPETEALRDFILKKKPSSVIFWHSKSNAVYASQCENGILPETIKLMNTYSQASGYNSIKTFDAYETTGAADDWLSSINIPAITVELQTHETIEWDRNLLGIQAILEYYK